LELRIVLVSPRNPLNIGAAARAISNFGFTHLRLVNAYDVAFREARSAVGASAVMLEAEEYPSVAEAVADCSLVVGTTSVGHRELKHPLRRIEYGGRMMRRCEGNVALLFGSEKFGLTNEELSHCHFLVRIPTRDEHASMNLGQAVAVCLYELVRNPAAARREPDPIKPAQAGEAERFSTMLIDALRRSGYMNPRNEATSEEKIRRLVRRLQLPARDAEVWFGIWRQILWGLSSGVSSKVNDEGTDPLHPRTPPR
jgi:tRNA/rRNA methyltransferase